MPPGPAARLLLAGVAFSVLAACGGGSGDASTQGFRDSAGAASQETTTTVVPAPTSTTAKSATTTTARPTTTGPTASATPSTTVVVAGTQPLTPPAPGTYRYDTSGRTAVGGTNQPFPAVTTLVVDPPSGVRQHSTRNLRDAAGNGSATEFTLEYRPQGVYLVSLRLSVGFGGVAQTRDLVPPSPVLLLATGAKPGAHSDAELGVAPATAHLTVDVLRTERVTIAGQGVDTSVMRAVVTLAPGDVTGRQELTVNVDPVSRLWVKEQAVGDASAAGGLFTLHTEYAATLQRLTP